MSKKKLVTTPLTNTIWWATVNEEKGMITGNREDVTDNAIDAVFQHFIGLEEFNEKGFAGYEIPKKNSDEVVTMCVFHNDKHICIGKELYEELLEYKAMYERLSKDDWNAEGNLPEINTCPFCGGGGILCDNGHKESVIDSNGAYVDMEFYKGDDFWCECKVCGAMTHGENTPEDAIMVWNKRA